MNQGRVRRVQKEKEVEEIFSFRVVEFQNFKKSFFKTSCTATLEREKIRYKISIET